MLVRSEPRWLLAALAWITLLIAALTEPWKWNSVLHFAIGVLVIAIWFAAFDRRSWLRSLLSATVVLCAVGTTTLEASTFLAPGVVLPGIGLFLLTAFRL